MSWDRRNVDSGREVQAAEGEGGEIGLERIESRANRSQRNTVETS